jgi:hypothetical protein
MYHQVLRPRWTALGYNLHGLARVINAIRVHGGERRSVLWVNIDATPLCRTVRDTLPNAYNPCKYPVHDITCITYPACESNR